MRKCSFYHKEGALIMELCISNVSKSFKDKKAVQNVTLNLTPGVWGLLGANGAG